MPSTDFPPISILLISLPETEAVAATLAGWFRRRDCRVEWLPLNEATIAPRSFSDRLEALTEAAQLIVPVVPAVIAAKDYVADHYRILESIGAPEKTPPYGLTPILVTDSEPPTGTDLRYPGKLFRDHPSFHWETQSTDQDNLARLQQLLATTTGLLFSPVTRVTPSPIPPTIPPLVSLFWPYFHFVLALLITGVALHWLFTAPPLPCDGPSVPWIAFLRKVAALAALVLVFLGSGRKK